MAEQQDGNGTDQLVQAIGAKALPTIFGPALQAKYPGYITTTGYGSGYNNAMQELEQRQLTQAREFAYESDATRASNTIVGLFMTAAKLSGKQLNDAEIAKIQQASKFHGRNIEVYLNMAKSMGLNETALNYIRKIFYGEKGSTVHMFDTTYKALRQRAGHGAALRFAQSMAAYQYGNNFDKEFTGGLNADQFATTYSFMLQNGGFSGVDLTKGSGFAVIDDRAMEQAVNFMPAGSSISETVAAYGAVNFGNKSLMARNNQRAIAMGTEVYKQKLNKLDHGQLMRELGTHLNTEEQKALKKVDEIDTLNSKIKKDFRLSIDKTNRDAAKAKEDLLKQVQENIAKAKEAKDNVAVKQLEVYGNKIAELMEDVLAVTDETDASGIKLNQFEIVDKIKANMSNIAKDKMVRGTAEYSKLKLNILAMKKKKHELQLQGGRDEDIKRIDEMIKYAETRKTAFENTSVLGETIEGMHGSKENEDKVKALGNTAMSIQAAMAAQGKPIQLEEALQASKALMPMGDVAQAMRVASDTIAQNLNGVTARGGSVEQFLLQMSSGKGIAEQYGASSLQATMLAGIGTNYNKYAALYGLTDAEAKKGADDLTHKLAQNQHRGVIAATMANIVHEEANGSKDLANAMAKLSPEDQKRFTELQYKLMSDGGPSALSDLDYRDMESLLIKSGLRTSASLRADSMASQRATTLEAEYYQEAVASAARETEFNEIGDKSDVAAQFGVRDSAHGRELYKNFFVKYNSEIREALAKGGVGGKEKLMDVINSADISAEDKAILIKGVDEGGLTKFEDVFDNSGLRNVKEATRQKATLDTVDHLQQDKNDNRIRTKLQSVFDQGDPDSLGKIVQLVSSNAFNASNVTNEQRENMLKESFGATLTNQQREAAAFSLLREGKLAVGMRYTGVDGKTMYLNRGDIDVATYAMQHPEEYDKKVKNSTDGHIEINGKKYTVAAASLALRNASTAAGEAVGLHKQTEGDVRTRLTQDADAVDATFNDNDSERQRLLAIRNLVFARANAVSTGLADPRYNEMVEKMRSKDYSMLNQVAKQIYNGEASYEDWGIDRKGRDETAAHTKARNATKVDTPATIDSKMDDMVQKQEDAVEQLRQLNTELKSLNAAVDAL